MPPPTSSPAALEALAADLRDASRVAPGAGVIDRLLGDALEALSGLIPYELATIMQLDGQQLRVRLARGAKAGPRVAAHRIDLAEFPSIREVLAAGRARAFVEDDHAAGDGDPFDGVLDLPHGHACMVVPLQVDAESLGVMTLDHSECHAYPRDVVDLADVVGKLLALAIRYGEQTAVLGRALERLEERHRVLREHGPLAEDPAGMLERARSPAMRGVVGLARQVATTATPVLITGETGTGKEVLAAALHAWSPRRDRPFLTLNCAALPPALIESELFGHVKGAFSGATSKRLGRFRAADSGTLFLDEVGELPLELQAKLLRVLQLGEFQPVGSDRTSRVDVRLIAATNRDLPRAVAAKRFREDLYYRLAVFPLAVPPLRARPEDIGPTAESLLDALHRRSGRGPWRLHPAALARLEARAWPGNVRELSNALERATILAAGPALGPGLFGPGPAAPAPAHEAPAEAEIVPLAEAERRYLIRVLRVTGGQVAGKGGAAERLGVPPSTLRSRMKKLGVTAAAT